MRRFLVSMALPALLACGGVRQMADLSLDGSELQGRFKTPMGLNLTNGWLVISVPDATINKVPPAEARAYAKAIATFAYTHYRHPKLIERVQVQFVTRTTRPGQVTYAVAGSWPVSELVATSPTTP